MTKLPKGWRFTPLCELGRWGGGGTPSKANASFWENGTIPWISSKDMKQDILRDSELHITAEAIRGSSARLVPRNSVAVVARSGILEHTLPVALVPFEATYNQDLKVVTPKPDVLPKFLMFAIQGSGQEILGSCRKAGTTVSSIEWPRFLQFKIAVPSLAEQQLIVEILEEQFSRLDAALASIRTVRVKAKAFRRSLLHSILQRSVEDSLPEDWVRIALGEVARVSAGRTPSKFESRLASSIKPNRVVPFYKVGDMNDAPQFMNTARVHFAEDEAGDFGVEILPSGSVVFPKAGGAIATNKKRIIQTPGAVDLNCMAVTASEAVEARFVYWFFESFDLTSLSDGSILPQIGKRKVAATSIAFPKSREEQVSLVASIEAEMTRLQNALAVTDQLEARVAAEHRSLLHAAFSGTLTAQWRETHNG